MIPEKYRKLIYTVFGAASVILLFYGISSEEEIAAWAAALSILGNGLATVNTSFKSDGDN